MTSSVIRILRRESSYGLYNTPLQTSSRISLLLQRRPFSDSVTSEPTPAHSSVAPSSGSGAASELFPPFTTTLRVNLKDALRKKNTVALPVIRALLADITNASKTAQPIKTDKQLQKRIKRRVSACRDAASQFASAGRTDLKTKEEDQAAVLEEFASTIDLQAAEQKA